MLPAAYSLSGLNDYSCHEEIPEPFDTFEANATAKASYVYKKTGIPCFADDSGLGSRCPRWKTRCIICKICR